MHFEIDSVPAEIPALMSRIVEINGWRLWKKRLDWMEEQVRVNPTMRYLLAERFGLELAFEQAHRHYKCSGRYPWPPSSAEQMRFYSFLSMIVRCFERLGPKGKICMA